MPYTLSHPFVVFPAKSLRNIDIVALIIGSITPDLIYFFTFSFEFGSFLHYTWLGIFTSFLIGIIAYLYWVFLGKKVFYTIFKTANPSNDNNVKNIKTSAQTIVTVLFSLLVGLVTHILLDRFTHLESSWVQNSFLTNTIGFIFIELPIYEFLQYFLSLVGFIIVIYWGLSNLKLKLNLSQIFQFSFISVIFFILGFILRKPETIITLSVLPISSAFLTAHFFYFRKLIVEKKLINEAKI